MFVFLILDLILVKGISGDTPIVLAGLHCCGQLSVNVLRLFATDPNCTGLALVGCCYGRLGSLGHCMSFPISEFGKRHPLLCRLDGGGMRVATESIYQRRQESAAEFDRALMLMFFRLHSETILERELGRDKFRCKKKVFFA